MSEEYPTAFWLERSLFAGLTLGNITYGLHVAVFCTTVYHMRRTLRSQRPMSPWAFLYVFVMFTLGTVNIAGNIKLYEHMWVDMRNIVGGPTAYLATHFNDPFNTLATSCYIIGLFLQDGMLLYRLIMIWDFWYPIIVIPVLAFMASTTLSVFTVVASSKPGSGPWTQSTIVFAVPFCALTVGFNIAMTLSIVGRMLFLRRRIRSTLGPQHGALYTSVASMFVESGAVYSVIGMVFIVSYGQKSNVQNLVLPSLEQSICIATELIMLRIALGRALTREATTQSKIQFNLPESVLPSSFTYGSSGNSAKIDRVLSNQNPRNGFLSTIQITRSIVRESDEQAEQDGSRVSSLTDVSVMKGKAEV